MDQLVVGVLLACGPGCRRFAGAQVSDRPADDLVDGLALAGLVVETGAAADQGTQMTAPAQKAPAAHQYRP
jgi:hypothetical protein